MQMRIGSYHVLQACCVKHWNCKDQPSLVDARTHQMAMASVVIALPTIPGHIHKPLDGDWTRGAGRSSSYFALKQMG